MSTPTIVPSAPDTERTREDIERDNVAAIFANTGVAVPPRPTAADWQRDPKQAAADVEARHENPAAAHLEALGWTRRSENRFGIGPDPDEETDDGGEAA